MIIKIFNRGKGRGEGPIGYLLGEKFVEGGDIRAGARVLSGDAFITQELINSSNFSKRYTSGVLSFEERPDEISDKDKKKIMQDFEQSMFPGMYPDRVNFLWVEHTDKENPKTGERRLELNFVIPNTEIYTGKRLQPYYHLQDAKYFRAWQTLTNDRFKLSDPDDPNHFRRVNPFDSNQSPKKTFENLKKDIDEFLELQMRCGLIENREDIIWQIENIPDQNFKVTRRSPKFISITQGDNKKPIRLKGFLFEEDFSYAEYQSRIQTVDDAAEKTVQKIETAASKQARLEQARKDFIGIYQHKKSKNIKKYNIPQQEIDWVSNYFAPEEIAKHQQQQAQLIQSNEQKNATPIVETAETSLTSIDENVAAFSEPSVSIVNDLEDSPSIENKPKVSEDLATDDLVPNGFSIEQIQRDNVKKKAQEKVEAEEREKERRRLEEVQQQRRRRESVERRKREEEERLYVIRRQFNLPIQHSYSLGAQGYDQGFKKLVDLIKDNFKLTFNQNESSYLDTVKLGIGRFDDKFFVTKDGRVGIDYSPYTNVKMFKYFYSSDLFELKNEQLYIKDTNTYYELSQFNEREREVLKESLTQSQSKVIKLISLTDLRG